MEKLTEGGGFVAPREDTEEEKSRDSKRARRESEDREAYGRIREGISENEEDHLDLDYLQDQEPRRGVHCLDRHCHCSSGREHEY